MGKLFGTDGVRGIANESLTAELAYRIGLSVAEILNREYKNAGKIEKPVAIIGKDTRISGDMLEYAMASGFCAGGCDVLLAGVVPTPAVAFLVRECDCGAGIMISASHNTSEYNGIKIFNNKGFKFSDEYEEYIEQRIETYGEIELSAGNEVGRVKADGRLLKKYIEYVSGTGALGGEKKLKILVDCANGSASATAHEIFKNSGFVNCSIIHASPTGTNINDKCGSTYLDILKEEVLGHGYDIGVAFDGDADRCLMVDEKGEEINGDKIMGLIAADMKKSVTLKNDTVVVTKLSNLGFHKFAEEHGINVAVTDVGDRYVLENMVENGFVLGGEQSGHVILYDYATTGDGQITALAALNIVARTGKKASEAFSLVKMYPQVSVNVKVPPGTGKVIAGNADVVAAAEKAEKALNGNGRVVLRPSGTEPLVRIMLEGENIDEITRLAKDIEKVILSKI